ncbi:hypothetical protein ACFPN7_48975, partial [Amycolatopsis halotolerans]|uniref:hypothetical protein n=1 Tax=Amycolatopsis halotolerans TaxID=330083 RepID=UPI00360692FC
VEDARVAKSSTERNTKRSGLHGEWRGGVTLRASGGPGTRCAAEAEASSGAAANAEASSETEQTTDHSGELVKSRSSVRLGRSVMRERHLRAELLQRATRAAGIRTLS